MERGPHVPGGVLAAGRRRAHRVPLEEHRKDRLHRRRLRGQDDLRLLAGERGHRSTFPHQGHARQLRRRDAL